MFDNFAEQYDRIVFPFPVETKLYNIQPRYRCWPNWQCIAILATYEWRYFLRLKWFFFSHYTPLWSMWSCPQRFSNGMKFHDNECFNLMFAALLFVESVIDLVCFSWILHMILYLGWILYNFVSTGKGNTILSYCCHYHLLK
jgi:hypothetical protein